VTSDVAGHNLILSLSVSRFLTVAVVVVSDLDNLACEEKDGSEVVHTRGVRLATAKSRASAPGAQNKRPDCSGPLPMAQQCDYQLTVPLGPEAKIKKVCQRWSGFSP
jgi:hypothetical protein